MNDAVTKQDTSPADVFRRFGLESPGFLGNFAVPARGDGTGTGPGEKLKDSFEQLGGVYLAFAEFLLWRADLLGVDYLIALRGIRRNYPPVPRDTCRGITASRAGRKGDELAQRMEAEPVWSTISRTAYLSSTTEPIVVQVAREPVPESALAEFETGIRIWEIRMAPPSARHASLPNSANGCVRRNPASRSALTSKSSPAARTRRSSIIPS